MQQLSSERSTDLFIQLTSFESYIIFHIMSSIVYYSIRDMCMCLTHIS